MRVVRVSEKVPRRVALRLHHLTDLHAGAPDFAEAELRKRIALIARDPYARWTMGGDAGDLVMFNDRRYAPTELHPRYRQAADLRLATLEHLLELFKPIAGKCWAWADGNHERHLDNRYGGRFGAEITTLLGISDRWCGYRGFVDVKLTLDDTKHMRLLVDIQHGWQAGRLRGAQVNQFERELSMTGADVALRGHSHIPHGHQSVVLTVPGGGKSNRIVQRHRSCINGGSWRHGYREPPPVNPNKLSEAEGDLWSESKGFRVEAVGGPVLALQLRGGLGQTTGSEPLTLEHTIITGAIDEATLGLSG